MLIRRNRPYTTQKMAGCQLLRRKNVLSPVLPSFDGRFWDRLPCYQQAPTVIHLVDRHDFTSSLLDLFPKKRRESCLI